MRVKRTFAFLDLAGFTSLTHTQGDQRAVDVLSVFRKALRDVCSRRAVRIAKWLGDGAMLVSVETNPLVAATLEMCSAVDAAPDDIAIKCGITCGPVILLEGDDYIGHDVNVAARLCDRAGPNEVLAVSSLIPQLPAWAEIVSKNSITVHGVEQPLEVVNLKIVPATPDTIPDPICQIPLTPATALERRHDGDGRVLLFCSASCAEMWEERRALVEHDAGSVRELWMR